MAAPVMWTARTIWDAVPSAGVAVPRRVPLPLAAPPLRCPHGEMVLHLGMIWGCGWAGEREGAVPARLIDAYPFAVIDDHLVCVLGSLVGVRL